MKLLETAFFFLFLIKYTYQSCGILTDYGNIKPEALDVEVNSDIVFNCTLNSKYHYNSSSIFFTLHNTDISKWSKIKIIDNLTAQLTVPKAQANQSGRYYCKVRNETNNSNLMVCVSEARVGHKPQDIPVDDLSCKYLYRQELKCQWTKPRNNIQTDIDFYRYNAPIYGFEKHCPLRDEHVDEVNDKTVQSCTWNKRTTERATYSLKYHFELNMSNALGAQQQFFIFNLSSIVQLDAPPNFTFNAELSTLAWDYPNLIDNDINLFPLLTFKVLVTEICDHSDACLDNMPKEYILENTRTNLKLDLKPYTLYNFSISCKVNDNSNKYWSSFSDLSLIRTKGAAPQSPPRLISQAFETSSTKSRSATIYWQPLPSYLKNGPSVTYLVSQLDNKHQVQSNRSTPYTNLTFESLDSTLYEFRIYSHNSFGLSREYSSIILPQSSDILQPPKKIAVIARSSSDYEMEWEKSDSKLLQNYTVFWCVAKNGHCVEGIQWKFLQSNNFTLSLPPNNYKFGVSLNTQHSTSGIYWTHCIVNPKTKIDKLRTVHPFTHGANSILIKWDFLCDAQKRLVPDMRIEFCPKNDCSPNNTRVLKVEDLSTNQFMVNDLSPNVTYSFVISSANIAEASHIDGTTDNGVPPPPFNVRILERTDNMTIIEWNFVPNVVDHFRVKAPFLLQDVIEPEESCNTTEQCNAMLVFSKPLAPFVNYSIAVSACNTKDDCSNSSQVFFQTAPSRPGKMLVPPMEKINSTHYRIHLRKPLDPNGPIDFYYILTKNKDLKRYNASEPFVDLPLECDKTEQVFSFKIVASNLVDGEELKGEPAETRIEFCKQYTGGLMALFIIVGVLLVILLIIVIYYVAKSMNNLKLKKKGFQLNIQCNQRETDLPFEQGEKDSLVHPEDNEFNHVIITDRRKISSSVTNASMTSDSSIAENSHSSDKIPSSSSDNCYNSDSTANYSDVNYRENHEYFLSPIDDSYRPLMAPSSEVDAEPSMEPSLSTAPPLDMDKASELNKSPASSYVPVENAVFVPLSPMPTTPASPPASLTSTHSHSQYISHDQIAALKQSPPASKFPNLRSSTNC